MRWERLNNVLQGGRRRIDEFLQCRLHRGYVCGPESGLFLSWSLSWLMFTGSCLHASSSPLIMFSDISKQKSKTTSSLSTEDPGVGEHSGQVKLTRWLKHWEGPKYNRNDLWMCALVTQQGFPFIETEQTWSFDIHSSCSISFHEKWHERHGSGVICPGIFPTLCALCNLIL